MSPPESLYLAYTAEQPPLAEYDIKRRVQRQFFGTEFTFAVIGDSHYIGAPELGFHELLSCKPIREGRVTTVPLTDTHRPVTDRRSTESAGRPITDRRSTEPAGRDRQEIHTGRYRFGSIGVTTTISREPLSAFPGPEPFDIAYRFDPQAYTTINCQSTTNYETYHTYPEYDLALYSEHEFTDLPAAPVGGEPTYETPNTKLK
ncbi:hypothetical protein [Halohasta salina]|uniref:hypothetical protein n=1 Tax=Halohasta salina TaxID=2961621 RepID=UPI0020A50BA8|nr:hypothetical protein [Halohasta salina]